MKNLILLIAVMVVSACASMPTIKSVAGTYEYKKGKGTYRAVFLKGGVYEQYSNGEKDVTDKYHWKRVGEEIHGGGSDGILVVIRINKDGSLTSISEIDKDGKRRDLPKEAQMTLKKIK